MTRANSTFESWPNFELISFELYVWKLTVLIAVLRIDFLGVCIRNCAQCKKMFGPYFLGQKCADSCVKYKGKLIPDCEDEGSIQPFLQALDSDY